MCVDDATDRTTRGLKGDACEQAGSEEPTCPARDDAVERHRILRRGPHETLAINASSTDTPAGIEVRTVTKTIAPAMIWKKASMMDLLILLVHFLCTTSVVWSTTERALRPLSEEPVRHARWFLLSALRNTFCKMFSRMEGDVERVLVRHPGSPSLVGKRTS